MAGIIPEASSGGLVVRSAAGTCTPQGNVSNEYCPSASFGSSCDILFLPDDCTARLTAAQTNAFQSEMLCLAELFNPDGSWECDSVCNLSTAFQAWQTEQDAGTLWRQMQTHACAMPSRTVAQVAALPNAAYLLCDGNGNMIRHVPAGNPTVIGGGGIDVLADVLADGTTRYTVSNECCPTDLTYDAVAGELTLTYGPNDTTLTTPIATGTGGNSVISNTLPAASNNRIATHTNGAGAATEIYESVTTLLYDPALRQYTYTNEAGTVTPLPYASTTVAGVAEIATDAEVGVNGCGGTDTTTYVTPDGLRQNRDYSTYPLTNDGVNHIGVVQEPASGGCKFRLKRGTNYHEASATNLMYQYFTASFDNVTELDFEDYVIPYPITNPRTIRAQLTDARYNPAGPTLEPTDAAYAFVINNANGTNTTVSLGFRQLTPGPVVSPSIINVFIPNGRT